MEVYHHLASGSVILQHSFLQLWLLHPGLLQGTNFPLGPWSSTACLPVDICSGSFWFSSSYSVLPRAGIGGLSPLLAEGQQDLIVFYLAFPWWLLRLAPFPPSVAIWMSSNGEACMRPCTKLQETMAQGHHGASTSPPELWPHQTPPEMPWARYAHRFLPCCHL